MLSIICTGFLVGLHTLAGSPESRGDGFAPPAAPLVACDPYFSVWSTGARLTDVDTTHWTGKRQRLSALVRVDGREHRLLGASPAETPALEQTDASITPTQSIYRFAGSGVRVELRFTTPLLPEDIDLLSRPITYVSFRVAATDDRPHEVALAFGGSGELCVDTPEQEAIATDVSEEGLAAVRIGSVDQPILQKQGDDLRIDWGYFYLAAPEDQAEACIGGPVASFTDADNPPTRGEAGELGGVLRFDLGRVGAEPVQRHAVLAYDDLYAIQFMQRNLRPYWRRNGLDAMGLLREAVRDYDSLMRRCEAFDEELTADLRAAGGDDYAVLGSLAYRQCFAAGKFAADLNGQPIQFSKENHSNGCVGTSDVFYPMAPQFLLFGPSLAKSFLVPFLEYAQSDRWRFPFAPHDLGTYPKANGQVYGGGETSAENQMPVEECGNLLLLMGAVTQMEGDTRFAERYWPLLTQWAEYLREKGFDPENQLCTDDFAGHLAHNVNLSAKAICGLAAYAQMCETRGDLRRATEYRAVAEEFAARWVETARDGDHYRLTFDRPGTWSQKYNLVWDRVLGLNLFPESVFRNETDHYLAVQNRYGLPLDNRSTYTKLDWILWSACLSGDDDDFRKLVAPVLEFLRETPDRSPMTDWYHTHNARKVGFTARPVVGGVFMRLLCEPEVWTKWAGRDQTQAGGYAGLPAAPVVTEVLPTSETAPAAWRYTTSEPRGDWFAEGYDDSSWRSGPSGFGREGAPNAKIGSTWDTKEVWLRREFDLPSAPAGELVLHAYHDDDAWVYLNGVPAARLVGYTTRFEVRTISEEARRALRPTGNVIAVRCVDRGGDQFVDVGLATVEYPDSGE